MAADEQVKTADEGRLERMVGRPVTKRVHWHTKWLRRPAGEWRSFYPGAYGLNALHGTSGASMRRQLRYLQNATGLPC